MTHSRHFGATPANKPRHIPCQRASLPGNTTRTAVATLLGVLLLIAALPVTASPEYRLSGVCSFEPRAGRLEFQPNASAGFGTVCDDSFDEQAALGACRSLGFADTVRAHVFAAPGGSGPIYADHVQCPVNASGLDECTLLNGDVVVDNSASPVTQCTHAEDVGIQCVASEDSPRATPSWEYRLTGGLVAAQGLLEVRPSASVEWGSVCGGSFTRTEGLVACRALGFTNLTVADVYVSARDPSTADDETANDELRSRTYLSLVDCAADVNATGLERCAHVPVPYAHCSVSEAVYLGCGVTSTFTYRLTGGHATMGVVEMKVPQFSTDEWLGVCDDSFDPTDALIACRSVGFQDTTHAIVVDYWTYMPDHYYWDYAMDEVECTGRESLLDECYYESDHDCDEEDVAVQCFGPTASAMHVGIQYRVNATNGLVEVLRSGEWGRVVYRDGTVLPDQRFANAVCTAAGAPTLGAQVKFWLERTESPDTRIVSMVAGTCAELPAWMNVTRPDECFWATNANKVSMFYVYDLHVDCGVRMSWEYAMLPGEIPGVGRALAHPSGSETYSVTGPTLAYSFGEARALCEAMGIHDTWSPFLFPANNPNLSLPTVRVSSEGGALSVSAVAVSHSMTSGIVCTTTTQAAMWEYRLVNGTSTRGALEVRPNSTSTWGTIALHRYLNSRQPEPLPRMTAKVLCRALGLPDMNASTFEVPYAEMSGSRVYWYDIKCDGSERNPAECVATPYPYAYAGVNGRGAIGVSCGAATENQWQYRLAEGGANWGRLEIQMPGDSQWYTVPHHSYFERDYYHTRHVACRSLGFGPLATGTLLPTIGGGGDMLQKRFQCSTGSEAELAMCYLSSYTSGLTSVTLRCDASPSPKSAHEAWFDDMYFDEVPLTAHSISFNGLTMPVSVCNPKLDTTVATGRVLCGFSSALAGTATVSYGSKAQSTLADVRITDLECPDGASSLSHCTYSASESAPCRSDDYLHVRCVVNTTMVEEVSRYWATHKYGFVLENADGTVTSPSSGMGRLLARVNTTALWGTVCKTEESEEADDHLALAACRSAGYGAAVAGYVFTAAAKAGSVVQLADLQCVSGAPTLDHCRLSSAAAGAGMAPACANASEVIGVQCVQPASEQQAWEYRLHGPEQLLEMRPAGDAGAEWGTVCSDSELGPLASLACSALGLPMEDPVAYLVDASAADLAKPVHMGRVSCNNLPPGSAASPESCRHVPRGFATCESGRRVGLRCGRAGQKFAGVRLTDSTFPGSGLVEVKTTANGEYAPVCSGSDPDDAVALAVCRSLGYVSSTVIATWVKRPPLTPRSALGYLRCRAGYDDASNCTFDTPVGFDGTCSSSNVLGVSCVEPAGAEAAGIAFKVDVPGQTSPVSVRLSAGSPWRPVCYRNDPDVLNVLCRTLGYAGGEAGRGVLSADEPGDFRFESSCPPGATHVSECKASYGALAGLGGSCSQLQLRCSGTPIQYRFKDGGVAPHKGTVETYRIPYYYGGEYGLNWYPVTVMGTYTSATLIPRKQAMGAMMCRSLGYGDASINVPASAVQVSSGGGWQKAFYGLHGNPMDVVADSFTFSKYVRYTTVVDCSAALQPTVWETQLALDGDVAGRGLLQVRPRTPDNSSYWAGIVAESIPSSLAHALCVSLGYAAGGVVVPRHPGTGSRIVYIQSLSCPGGAVSLAECTWSSSGLSSGARNAGLQCFNGTQPSADSVAPTFETCAISVPTPAPTTAQDTPVPPTTTDAPTTGVTTPQPTTAEPTTQVPPTTMQPTTAEPTTAMPTTAQPTTAEPTTVAPTPMPTTATPVATIAPTTAEPSTAPPTSARPTTAEPTTAKPTTVAPTEPTTAVPVATAAPTTAKPTTAAPTQLHPTAQPPSAEPTTAQPTATQAPTVPPTTLPTTSIPTSVKPSPVPVTTAIPTQLPIASHSPLTSVPTSTQASRVTGGGGAANSPEETTGESAGIAAGTTLGVLLFIAIIVAIVLIVRRQRKPPPPAHRPEVEPPTAIVTKKKNRADMYRVSVMDVDDPQAHHVDFPSTMKDPEDQFFEMGPMEEGVHSPTFAVSVNSGDSWAVRPRRSQDPTADAAAMGGELQEHRSMNPIDALFDAESNSVRSATCTTAPEDRMNQDASLVRGREE